MPDVILAVRVLQRFHGSRLRLSGLLRPSAERSALVFYAGLYAASAGLLKLAGFVLFLWLARTLSVKDYAAIGLSYSLQTGLTMVAFAGVVEAVVGQLRAHRLAERQNELFSAANVAFVRIAVPTTVVAFCAFVVLVRPRATDLATLGWVLGSGLLLAFASMQAQVIRLQERHVASICLSFLVPLSGFVGGFVTFVIERTEPSFFFGMFLGTATALIGLRLLGIGFYSIVDRIGATRTILRGVGPFIAIGVLGWLSGYGNNYLVQLFFESTEVARFTFALMVTSIMQLVATALNQVWSPRFFRLVHELPPEIAERGYRRFSSWQALALGLAGATIIAVFPSLTRALGGNLVSYQSMRLELLLMVSTYVLLTPWWHCYNYFLIHGEGREVMRITVATSLIGVIAWTVSMLVFGPIGIYAGFTIQMLLRVVGIVISARKRWPVTIAWEGLAAGILLTLVGFVVSGF